MKMGKYIYGIINSDKDLFFASCKVIAGKDVYTISYQDISAVVSNAEIVDYYHLAKDTIARYLLRHQSVIEKVMEEYNIIPMQLGTYAVDEDEVRHILANGYQMIKDIFERIYECVEIDVVATWSDPKGVLKEVGEEEEIKGFKQALLNKKEGVTFADQVEIGSLIKKHLDKKRERYANEIEASLVRVSQNHRAHGLMDDKMILNMAFLVEKSRQKDFEKIVEYLDTKFDEKLNFRCIGPLLPYSFNTLEVKKIPFTEIASAKERLNLRDNLTEEEIERAYRHKTFLHHPDKNPGRPEAAEQFARVTRDYKMLLEYSRSGVCSFKDGAIAKDAIVVRVRN